MRACSCTTRGVCCFEHIKQPLSGLQVCASSSSTSRWHTSAAHVKPDLEETPTAEERCARMLLHDQT